MKTALTIALISALLLVTIAGCQFSNLAAAQNYSSITIKVDGSIEPPTAPITQSGNVYQLTQDILGCITVERFSIVIDGAGHSLQGNGSWRGIQIFNPYNASTINRYDVTVKNFVIEGFDEAIDVFGYWGNKISGVVLTNNTISGNNIGIRLSSYERYTNNIIAENKIYQNSIGISMEMGHTGENGTNTVTHNVIAENDVGIKFLWMGDYYGPKPNPFQMNNTIYKNNFRENTHQVLNAHVIYDPDCANIWDNNALGNYWSDYEGEDSDGDGIGDIPYVIDSNNLDLYPLTHPFSYYMNKPTATPTPSPSPTLTLTPTSTPYSTINTGAQPPQAEPYPTSVLVVPLILITAAIASTLLYRKHKKTADLKQ
ncbi:DUF1565 domain-containing protein [Candidatus Bathyarchaeota archaeon]|nr:DUF1565 domain-containing protein [Candidatus Bathyarchaeota archaeon]